MWKLSRGARRRLAGWTLAALAACAGMSPPVKELCSLPSNMYLTQGYGTELSFHLPVRCEVGDQSVLSSADQSLGDVTLTGERAGATDLTFKLLGFSLKKTAVRVRPERIVIPGGQSIGVAIHTDGVLVVGASDLSGSVPSPARLAGLKAGDQIKSVDGAPVTSASQLTRLIAGGGDKVLTVCREERTFRLTVRPLKDERDGVYRLGAWVRDSTAGVGTLSFYDPTTGGFGALGHAITDVDTGTMLTVREGEILPSAVTDIHRGVSGDPGELVGEFTSQNPLGQIAENTQFGIYGGCAKPIANPLYPDGIPVMARSEVHLGKAQLLTTLDGEGVRAFDCEITKLSDQDEPSQRSMVVKVTDKELLQRTGGIVQGMSGSPIVQDGRMAGAVTHVYVNDPTQGFGIYVEWMLEKVDAMEDAA